MSQPPVPADENLPEVVPDSSPQALSSRDAYLAQQQLGEKDPKYIAETSPRPEERDLKFAAVDGEGNPQSPDLVKGEDGVWRPAPVSALSPTDTNAITPDPAAAEGGRAGEEAVKEKKVCGMKRRTFWIVVAVALVIAGVAIGVGVGVGVKAQKSSSSSPEPSDEGKDEPPTDEEDDTSDDTPDENFLNNGTAPERGFAFQAFSEGDYGGEATDILTAEGFHNLGFDAFSYVWVPNDTGCCISFCQNTSDTDQYWCEPRKRDRIEGDTGFPRLGVLCGNSFDTTSNIQKCSEEEEEEEEEPEAEE